MLQDIVKQNRDRGLTLLAVSIDSPETQPKIPDYLKQHHLDCRVLLAGDEGVRGFNVSAASSLFVVDRRGYLAGVPSQFYSKLETELARRLPDLLAGKPTPGPVLWAMEGAPEGLRELWREDLREGAVSLAVAPATSGRAAEIGILDGAHHLRRYSATGQLLGSAEPEDGNNLWGLVGADLDGDGVNEWLARTSDEGLTVMDAEGERYWDYFGFDGSVEIGGVADLDGDGRKEIVVRSGDTVTALRNVPVPLWRNRSLTNVMTVRVDSSGAIRVQAESGLLQLDPRGNAGKPEGQASWEAVYQGEVSAPGKGAIKLFGSRYGQYVDGDHDLDGDGSRDVVVSSRGGVSVYAQDGSTILSIFIAENQDDPKLALADLDGRPGDEMILFIPQYGLVALGMQADGPQKVAAR